MANPEPSRKVEKRSYPQLYINQVEFRYGNVQFLLPYPYLYRNISNIHDSKSLTNTDYEDL